MALSRRKFIQLSAASVAALSANSLPAMVKFQNGMPFRTLGKTGLQISLLAVGGGAVGKKELSDEESIKLMRSAIDQGINFFDNAWDYHDGRSEVLMGKALQDGYREKVVLMTKHHGRKPEFARKHLEESLKRLKTDVIDVWQFHEIDEQWEIDSIYSSGVLDFALKAKEEGKIKHIGFTGHFRPALHLQMIHKGFEWETIQMPINVLDQHFLSFSRNVLPVAVERNIGVIAMKTLGGGAFLEDNIITPAEALRFAMTLPVSTVASGMDSIKGLNENVNTAKNFTPMSEEEISKLLERTIKYALNGQYEGYKTYTPDPDHEFNEVKEG